MAKTIWQEEDRKELCERLARLSPNSKGKWGKMSCEQMLAHIADGLKMPLGELSTTPKKSFLRYKPVKKLIIYYLPFPKGAPTAPELLARTSEDIQTEITAISVLMEEFAASDVNGDWTHEHPSFGKLSGKDWGVLAYKHIDHHLKQFGV